jgi:hypothetical protein
VAVAVASFALALGGGIGLALSWEAIKGSSRTTARRLNRWISDSAWDFVLEEANRRDNGVEVITEVGGTEVAYYGSLDTFGQEVAAAEPWIYLTFVYRWEIGKGYVPLSEKTVGMLFHRAEIRRLRFIARGEPSVTTVPVLTGTSASAQAAASITRPSTERNRASTPVQARRGWELLGRYRAIAPVAVGLILGPALTVRMANLLTASPRDEAFIAASALMVATLILAILFYYDTGEELEQLRSVGEEFLPPIPRYVFLVVVSTILGFAVLIVASASPTAFGLALLSIKGLELFGSRSVKARFRTGLVNLRASEDVSDESRAGADVLETYYLRRPWDLQLGFEVAVVAIAIAIALSAPELVLGTGLRMRSEVVEAVLIVVAIVANEIFAARWRWLRDSALPQEFL